MAVGIVSTIGDDLLRNEQGSTNARTPTGAGAEYHRRQHCSSIVDITNGSGEGIDKWVLYSLT